MSNDPSTMSCEALQSLRMTKYDRASSLLISLLILSASSFVVLLILWLACLPRQSMHVAEVKFAAGGKAGDPNGGSELETPALEELVAMPVVDPISNLQALIGGEAIQSASQLELRGAEGPPGAGGSDPSRPAGPPERVPRWERWEIRYSARTLNAYARQLDFLEIELGAAGGKATIDYARRFTGATPLTRTGTGSGEERLYMTWRQGRLMQWDRTLLKRAGLDVRGRIVMQFYPEKLERALAKLEAEHAEGKTVEQIRKTVFELKRDSDGYAFVIIAQQFQ